MEKEMVTVKVSSKSLFLLLKLMGMDHFIGYTNPFEQMDRQQIEKELLREKNTLLFEKVLVEVDGRIVIEPVTYSMLQALKLCGNIAWFHLKENDKVTDSYYYISSSQVIRVAEEPDTVEFTLIGELRDFFEEVMDSFDKYESSLSVNKIETIIDYDTYTKLLKTSSNEESISNSTLEPFIQTLREQAATGQLVFIHQSEGILGGVRFVLNTQNCWILSERSSDKLNLRRVSINDMFKEMFDTYVSSFRSLAKKGD